ncbi:MAG: hypothetical protein ACI934_001596, partial [Pseudohongiellaceae bacterium]
SGNKAFNLPFLVDLNEDFLITAQDFSKTQHAESAIMPKHQTR